MVIYQRMHFGKKDRYCLVSKHYNEKPYNFAFGADVATVTVSAIAQTAPA